MQRPWGPALLGLTATRLTHIKQALKPGIRARGMTNTTSSGSVLLVYFSVLISIPILISRLKYTKSTLLEMY